MLHFALWPLVALLGALATLHLYWAFGGRWAFDASIPSQGGVSLPKPGPAACGAVASVLLAAAALCTLRSGYFALLVPSGFVHWSTVAIGAVFALRAIGDFRLMGFFKREHGSEFARRDTRIYSPLCALIAALATVVHFVSG